MTNAVTDTGTLILQDGSVLKGKNFGAQNEVKAEIVFNTSMTGYQEILTDPSYFGQVVILTYPEIGNYGINDDDFEALKPGLKGLIVKNYSEFDSHYKSKQNLRNYLINNSLPALFGIDTRSLVQKIREKGTMGCFISPFDLDEETVKEKIKELQNFEFEKDSILHTTTDRRYNYSTEGEIDAAFIDYGVKKGILNSLAKRNCKLTVYRADTTAEEILENNHDIVFLSNGPGDPADYVFQIEQLKKMVGKIPIFGICLGYQLLALTLGAKTFKLKYGHRGANHPVINLENNKVLITSQNHGYGVDTKSLPKIIRKTYLNLDDETLEGFEVESLKIYAVQFHPEASPGPEDASIIFDEWANIMKNIIKNTMKNPKK